MRLKFYFLAMAFLPVFGFSQITSSIDIIGGMDYSYRYLSTDSGEEIIHKILDLRNDNEVPKLNWRAGFNYNTRLSKKVMLRAGIRFSSEGYKTKVFTDFRWGSENNGTGGMPTDPPLPIDARYVYNYYYIEIPVAGRWEFSEKKFAPFVELGISPSYYTDKRVKLVTDIDKTVVYDKGALEDFKNFHFVGFVSFGFNYMLADKIQIFAQPIFRYHFTEIAKAPIHEFLYNGGIEIGVRRKLNKEVEAEPVDF